MVDKKKFSKAAFELTQNSHPCAPYQHTHTHVHSCTGKTISGNLWKVCLLQRWWAFLPGDEEFCRHGFGVVPRDETVVVKWIPDFTELCGHETFDLLRHHGGLGWRRTSARLPRLRSERWPFCLRLQLHPPPLVFELPLISFFAVSNNNTTNKAVVYIWWHPLIIMSSCCKLA